MIRRKSLLFCVYCLLAGSATAQYNTLSDWYIGTTAGATASTISMTPKLVDKFYSLGRNGGLVLRYKSESNFGLQLEFKYSEAGWKEDYYQNKNWSEYTYSRTISFVEIPVLSHIYTTSGASNFFFNFGANLQYYLSESEENRSPEVFVQHGKLVENTLQYGLLGGAGLDVRMGRMVLGLEGRYCLNLSNIYNDAVGNDFVNSSLKVISLNMTLLYQFSATKKK